MHMHMHMPHVLSQITKFSSIARLLSSLSLSSGGTRPRPMSRSTPFRRPTDTFRICMSNHPIPPFSSPFPSKRKNGGLGHQSRGIYIPNKPNPSNRHTQSPLRTAPSYQQRHQRLGGRRWGGTTKIESKSVVVIGWVDAYLVFSPIVHSYMLQPA
jgi:hypothetical protein